MMSTDQASNIVISAVSVTREDIARAKSWIMESSGVNARGMCDDWLRHQGFAAIGKINTDAEDATDILKAAARQFSVRLAFYQATWELVSAGVFFPPQSIDRWEPNLDYQTSHYGGGIDVKKLGCTFPSRLERLPLAAAGPSDPDIFLKGVDCATLHSGIHEAIEQSLICFRRGLYMPAIAMLTAAAEATWTECGSAVAKCLSDAKLTATTSDPYSSIGKIVTDVRKALEHKNAKPLLEKAGQSIHQVVDAEIWTTTLRDRRNALHWGKSKSFIADHSETGTLLMAAPQHIRTLEAIRAAC